MTIKKKKKQPEKKNAPTCTFNVGVVCSKFDMRGNLLRNPPRCETCGWNPDVSEARNKKMGIIPG